MPELPGGGYTVVLICGCGLAMVAYFAWKESSFKRHFRRGCQLAEKGDYHAALWHLLLAEKRWMLRLSKQTMKSSAEDCRNLMRVLELIGEAARHCSLDIETSGYWQAANEMEQFFLSKKRSSRNYPSVYNHFREQQKRFRANMKNIHLPEPGA
ncbi:hypothetical protein NXS98_07445 [Fontisphaera persica]|uniref:hypothetical protein n=1 Tax=Fontisphaera persica TaxID=2974023 RepID=UPI0024BFF86B|nr:hypothetical protein [Fontisphaera persica]WCJ60944.1 hypothetical protein NXS98_07445 [Fontisphaera persica]